MSEFTLGDLIDVCSKIKNAKPSQFVQKDVVGNLEIIKDVKYEIRLFHFQGSEEKTFSDFVEKNKLKDLIPTVYDNGYAKLHCFNQNEAQKVKGEYYFLSLRKL